MARSIVLILFCFLLLSAALAGPGHDHGDGGHGSKTAEPTKSIPRLESVGSDVELVATAQGHTLTIYLDRLATNEPVDGATIEVAGADIDAAMAKSLGEGTYKLEAEWVDVPGTKALTFTVMFGDQADLLNGTLEIETASREQTNQSFSWSTILASPAVWSLLTIAALFGFFLSFAFRPVRLPPDVSVTSEIPAARPSEAAAHPFRHAAEIILIAVMLGSLLSTPGIAGPGHDHGDGGHDETAAQTAGSTPRKLPEGNVFVPKPSQRLLRIRTIVASEVSAQSATELVGTVIADPSFEGRVQAPMSGQIELPSGGVSFVGQSVQAGDVLAVLSPEIPVYDRGQLQQLTADVDGKLRIAEQRLSRLTRIANVVAQRDIEDTTTEIDSLREQKRVLAPKSAEKLLLKAPISGVISVANVRAGQVVIARDTLFEIVDPKRLWVEAIGASGADDFAISQANALDGDGHRIALSFVGRAPALRQQSQPLSFKVEDAHAALAIGATVKVTVQGAKTVKGIVLPEAAVVRGLNGLPLVWSKLSAERFKPVSVRVSPLDGSRVLITAGILDGSRIVTDGAEFINQIR